MTGEEIHMSKEPATMRAAFSKARESLNSFLEIAAKRPAGTTTFQLKIAVSDVRGTEYIWIKDFVPNDDTFSFTGVVDNEPRLIRKYAFGEKIRFYRFHIVDWSYKNEETKKLTGNFTACVLLGRESREKGEELKARYGFQCE
jgi:uncharacterized protein YegJ (DUF2314 family)